MPREMVCLGLKSVQKWSAVKGARFHDWRIITGGMNCVLHESITCSVRFDGFCMKYAGMQAGMSLYLQQYYGNVHYDKFIHNNIWE